MCGIAGDYGGIEPDIAERMLKRLVHRGPDGEGSVEVAGNWLGHRRLSIVDVEGGKQPLQTKSGELFLVGNGEIYNHEKIRETLPEDRFSTHSDNEVALHLFDLRGPDVAANTLHLLAPIQVGPALGELERVEILKR